MFVAQPYGTTLNLFGVDDTLAHEGIDELMNYLLSLSFEKGKKG
jgi:hypothetical protein